MVQPKKAPELKQSRQIHFRLSEVQFEKLQFSAAQVGQSASNYAKQRALKTPLIYPKFSPETAQQLTYQLAKIGNNLNQLTRLANLGYPVASDDLWKLRQEVTKLWQQLN